MAAESQKAINDEMFDRIVLEVYEYVKDGRLSKMRARGVAREIAEMRDDKGELLFYDARFKGEKREIKRGTFYERVKNIVTDWRKYITPLMETLIIEATYQQALKAKDNPASFKTAASIIMPKESGDDEDKPAIPPRVDAILRRAGVGTPTNGRKDSGAEKPGDNGHKRADTVYSVADGRGQDITVETVPLGHADAVHGLHEGEDTTEGYIIPDTPVASEDAIIDDSGADLDTPE